MFIQIQRDSILPPSQNKNMIIAIALNLDKCLSRFKESVSIRVRNGNGYVPGGYWPPVPAPARSKPIPSGYPRKQTGKKFIPYPHPMGNSYPTGIPYPKIYPSSIEI